MNLNAGSCFETASETDRLPKDGQNGKNGVYSPRTRTGVKRLVIVPSPSCPDPFDPQQYVATPVGVTPHACDQPVPSLPNVMVPGIRIGVEDAVVVPLPN